MDPNYQSLVEYFFCMTHYMKVEEFYKNVEWDKYSKVKMTFF